MRHKKNITGIILAGGKSTRMGYDKGFISFNGKTFIQYSIDALNPLVDDIIIVSHDHKYDSFNLKRVDDLIENSGPLAGIYTGLYHSKTTNNIVLSCDIPMINQVILKELIQQNTDSIDVTLIESNNKQMPLIALYKKDCMYKCLELLNIGEKRLKTLIQHLNSKTILLEHTLEKHTANINTQLELKTLNNELEH
jgi:molybdopterin-guanine dinucleotide biosynthesis protein A